MSKNWVIWDFDGTLGRSPFWSRCLLEVLDAEEPGHQLAAESLRPFLRKGFPWHDHESPHLHLKGPEEWWEIAFGILSGACVEVGYSEERAAVLAKAARDRFVDCASWEVFEDAVPALSGLKKKGWRHAVLSNHVPELEDVVRGLELADLIDVVVSSANTGYEKPHPMAYEILKDGIGEYDQLWMVGDNPIADVAGPERVGIPAILVRSPEWTKEYVSLVTDTWGGTSWRDWQTVVTRTAVDLVEAAEIIAAAAPHGLDV